MVPSEHHQNNNLKVVLLFGNFVGKDNSFYESNKKDQVLEFNIKKVMMKIQIEIDNNLKQLSALLFF